MKRDQSRRFAAGFIACLALAIAGVSLFNFVVDPLQVFRIPTLYKPAYFPGFQRFQYVGLARNYEYDTVVIGSSLLENFIPSYINRSWGGVRTMKLAISGSTSYEQFLILREALETGRVRSVIWGLDYGAFTRPRTWVRDDQAPFPYHMYRRPRFANIEYLYSLDTIGLSRAMLKGWGEHDLDQLDAWHAKARFGEEITLKAWSGKCEDFAPAYRDGETADEQEHREMRIAVEKNLAEVVRSHPRVTFYLFIPPVSILSHFPKRNLAGLISFKRLVLNSLVDRENVRFHDFTVDTDAITDDLVNYKDAIHFSMGISEYVIDAMGEGRHRVLRKDIEPNVRKLIDHVNDYDLCRSPRRRMTASGPHQ